MNKWITFRRCLVAGVIAGGMLVVPQAALADHVCLCTGECINIADCGSFHGCGFCGPFLCSDIIVTCAARVPLDEPYEFTPDETVSPEAPPQADAAKGGAQAEPGAVGTRGAGLALLLLIVALPVALRFTRSRGA